MGALTIYGDSISGNCMKVRVVAERLGIPFRWIETSVMEKATRMPEFLAMNPAGQVPFVTLSDGRPLSQSNAIMLHLAEGSDLIPADAYQRAQMFQWLFWEQYTHEPAIAVLRFRRHFLKQGEAELDPNLIPRSKAVLDLMERHLIAASHFVGDRLSLADIGLVAYTRWSHEAGLNLAGWPNVGAWVSRIEGELGL